MLSRKKQLSVWTFLGFCGIAAGSIYLCIGFIEKSWDEGMVGLIDLLLGFLLLPPLNTTLWFKVVALFLMSYLSVLVSPI